MKSGYIIDSFLLKKFQSVSDWIQEIFGIDNFEIARFLRAIMFAAFIFREVIVCLQGINITEVVILACSVTLIVKVEYILHASRESLRNKHEIMNSAVLEYAVTRITMLLIATVAFGLFVSHLYSIITSSKNIVHQYSDWKELFWDVFSVLLFFITYFSSCTPRPYKPSRLKRFIQSTEERLKLNTTSSEPKPALS